MTSFLCDLWVPSFRALTPKAILALALAFSCLPLQAETAPSGGSRVLRDPFRTAQQQKDGAAYSAGQGQSGNSLPSDIELRGVFIVEGRKPGALVRVGGDRASYFVTVGDSIPLRARLSERFGGGASALQTLIVVGIRPNEITVAPKDRPEELITIR